MYIMINDIKGEKRIDLSYPIHLNTIKEIAVIIMLSDNIQYNIVKLRSVMNPDTKKLIPSGTYAGRKLLSMLLVDDQVIKKNKLKGITEMILNLDELDNTDNLEDGRPSNSLLTYHVTSNEDFTSFEPQTPQYKKLKNGGFTSLTLRITDQNNNIITDGLQVTVVLHIRDCNKNSSLKMENGNKLNPEHSLRTAKGIKRTRQKVIVTHNPSEIDQKSVIVC